MRETRGILRGLPILLALACSTAPQQTYPGPGLPISQVALLQGSFEAMVVAIDREQVWGSTWALLPGEHEIVLRMRIHTDAPNRYYTVWSYCRVDLLAVAGDRYEARVRTQKEIAPANSNRVKIEIGIADASGALRAMPRSCSGKPPHFGD